VRVDSPPELGNLHPLGRGEKALFALIDRERSLLAEIGLRKETIFAIDKSRAIRERRCRGDRLPILLAPFGEPGLPFAKPLDERCLIGAGLRCRILGLVPRQKMLARIITWLEVVDPLPENRNIEIAGRRQLPTFAPAR